MSSSEYQEYQKTKKSTVSDKRQFGCPCGKFYLSYPALFTHVKQKHQGQPPGELIKPKKKDNIRRGRPPLHPSEKSQSQQSNPINLHQYFIQKIPQETLKGYNQKFEWKSGTKNCNQIFSKFLKTFGEDDVRKRSINCFIFLMKEHLNEVKGEKFCEEQNASQIIDISNEIVNNWGKYSSKYNIQLDVVISLLWGFFTWLYKEKLTNHKLELVKSKQP